MTERLRSFDYTLSDYGENVSDLVGRDITVADYLEMECSECGEIKTYFFEEIRQDGDIFLAAYACEGCEETFEFRIDEVSIE